MQPHELRAKAAQLKAEAQSLYDQAKTAEAGMSDDVAKRYDTLLDQAEQLMKTAVVEEARWNRLNEMDAQLRQSQTQIQVRDQARPDRLPEMPHNDSKNTRDGLHTYSLCKAILQMADGGIGKVDGLERECHEELKRHKWTPARGLLVPWDLPYDVDRSRRGRAPGVQMRALDTTTGVGSIPTILSPNLIDLLRARLVTVSMGATVLTGMQGLFAIPRQSAGATGYWVAENTAVTASNQTLDQVPFSPKTCGTFTDITRKFMEETSLNAEQFVRDDLTAVIARTVETAAINGSGLSNQPRGILNIAAIPTVKVADPDGGNPTWATIVNLESTVAVANADMGSLGYVTNASVRGWLKQAPKVTNFPVYIWNMDSDLPLNGYPVGVSNLVPNNLTKGAGTALSAAIFGNWADLVFAFWSGMDLLVDPYTGSASGTIRIVCLQDVDVNVRHPESFAKCVDIKTV